MLLQSLVKVTSRLTNVRLCAWKGSFVHSARATLNKLALLSYYTTALHGHTKVLVCYPFSHHIKQAFNISVSWIEKQAALSPEQISKLAACVRRSAEAVPHVCLFLAAVVNKLQLLVRASLVLCVLFIRWLSVVVYALPTSPISSFSVLTNDCIT